eukprot:262127-Alexandrium_andersonii.AAC.1
MPEPADAGRRLVHGVVAQASLATDRARQGRPGVAILDDEDRQRRATAILRGEAVAHCKLWRCVCAA